MISDHGVYNRFDLLILVLKYFIEPGGRPARNMHLSHMFRDYSKSEVEAMRRHAYGTGMITRNADTMTSGSVYITSQIGFDLLSERSTRSGEVIGGILVNGSHNKE